jgi:hypothetical protein
MKKIYILSCCIIVAAFFGGCGLATFYPIFTPEGLVYDSRLLGNWANENDTPLSFQPASTVDDQSIPEKLRPYKNKFFLQQTHDTKRLAFLTIIGNHFYLDVYPLEENGSENVAEWFYSSHLVKRHLIYRVDFLNAGALKIRSIEQDYLEKLLKSKEVRMPFTVVRESSSDEQKILVTSPTEDLQRFIAKYGDDEKAYNNEHSLYTKSTTVVYLHHK